MIDIASPSYIMNFAGRERGIPELK